MNGKATWVAVVAVAATLIIAWTNITWNVSAAEQQIRNNKAEIEELKKQTKDIGEIKAKVGANSKMLGRLIDRLLDE